MEYRYRFNGESFTSHQHKQKPGAFSDYGKAARLAEPYRPGSSELCYVNPSVPSEAILQRGNLRDALREWYDLAQLSPRQPLDSPIPCGLRNH